MVSIATFFRAIPAIINFVLIGGVLSTEVSFIAAVQWTPPW
jgi:hypothetical protein